MGPLIPGPDAPPWGLGMAPPRTRRRPRARSATISTTSEFFGRGLRERVTGFRAEHGLPPMAGTFNEFSARLPLYLVGSVAELDYNRRDLPPTVHYVGALHLASAAPIRRRPRGSTRIPHRPSRGCTSPRRRSTTATRSSSARPRRARGRAGRGDPDDGPPARPGGARPRRPLAPNVHLTRWLSHGELLPRCAAMVTAGGTATILSSLRAGVPLVVVPTTWDKPDNARRVVEAGVGVRLAAEEVHARRSARGGRGGARRAEVPRERAARGRAAGRARRGRARAARAARGARAARPRDLGEPGLPAGER